MHEYGTCTVALGVTMSLRYRLGRGVGPETSYVSDSVGPSANGNVMAHVCQICNEDLKLSLG